ncbi:MAG: nucleotide kinase domain-containing protein [Phycisphaeraceae bacterium]
MTQQAGDLYIFEGPDAVGKSTLADAFANALRDRGRKVTVTASPGRNQGTIGELVYRLHHDSSKFDINTVSPASLQTLHVAAHIDALETEIRPLIDSGTDVVLDRCWISTLAYGRMLGVDHATLKHLIALELQIWSSLRPRLTFLVSTQEPLRQDYNTDVWHSLKAEYQEVLQQIDSSWQVQTLPNNADVSAALNEALRALPKPIRDSTRKSAPCRRATKSKLHPVVPTKVYDTYWYFAAERQKVLFSRLSGDGPPYTEDPILSQYRFTNAYRVADRVSQYLLQHVIENSENDPDDLFFRIILYKTFNKIDTWEHFVNEFGEPHWDSYDFAKYDRLLSNLSKSGYSIYSAAYIMPSGGNSFGYRRKHQNHLALIEAMIRDRVPQRIADSGHMKDVFELLCSYPMIGPFLGYQYATDINYSPLTDFSEMEFVIPGPGAKDGIRKCFTDQGGLSDAEIIRLVTERQEQEFASRGIEFRRLGDRPLQLIDCQNLFCEVDKYARVAHPDIQGISGRTRIKQKYRSDSRPLGLMLPSKWGDFKIDATKEQCNAGLLFG